MVNAKEFLSAWLEAVEEKKKLLLDEWKNARGFTLLIKGSEESIMQVIAGKLNMLCYPRDYYCLDTILYKEEDLVPERPVNSYWFRRIRVAFEHENFFNRSLYQEVSHLMITAADLKVLVSYPNGDPGNVLSYLHEVIRGSDQQKELSEKEGFLLILGYENRFEWEAFVYKETEWRQIL